MKKSLRDAQADLLPCPAPLVFNMIGGKWTLSILLLLIFRGTKRFGELRREIDGVTQTMHTNQLRALENDGVVAREVFPEVPPRVEYSASEDALALKPMFKAMHKWWEERRGGRPAETATGKPADRLNRLSAK